ncbi:MAG: hypothetical protein NXH75_03865 [Halobacteriovoraceae bacterium]|nr:hypothetical protein [Halobacteriovoraceae bacterium]
MKYKLIPTCLALILGFAVEAKEFVVVGVSGFGTRKPDNAWQPSGAHEKLPYSGKIAARFELVHYAKTRELKEILKEFECEKGIKQDNKGMVILANSWGSGKAHKLAKMYLKKCGEMVDAFYLVDGVTKPIGAFKRDIPAKVCINYYQTKGVVRGTDQKNCVNHNLTKECEARNYSAVQCHIHVEWEGAERSANHMRQNYLN